MAKNKQKGKKQKNVFQVANKHLKIKNKTKPVTTALKNVRSFFHLDVFLLNCEYVNLLLKHDVWCKTQFGFTLASFVSRQINAVKKDKVENLNQMFTEVQNDVKNVSKSVPLESKKQTQVEEKTLFHTPTWFLYKH